MSRYVKVPIRRIKELLNYEDQLLRLEGAGVDNWQGYEECWDDYESEVSDKTVQSEFPILEE